MTTIRNVYLTDASTGDTANVESTGELTTHLHPYSTAPLIIPFHTTTNSTTLATAATAKDDLSFDVASTTGFIAGAYITIYNISGNRWFQAHQVGAVSGSTVTVDTPLDFEYQIGDQISVGSSDLAVDGSSTSVVYTVRDPEAGLTLTGDITRIILVMECATACSWAEFGDLTALTNGLVLRKTDSVYQNIFNVKSNKELANVMYDTDIFIAGGPAGVDGVKGRITFGGDSKIGTIIRLASGEDLELIVQDNIAGLTSFQVYAEGYISTHV